MRTRMQLQSTTATADSAAEHRCLLRRFTRTIRAGEAAQQTAGAGVACPANAHVPGVRLGTEAGACEGTRNGNEGGDFFGLF